MTTPAQSLAESISRRDWLNRTGAGFAGLALASLLCDDAVRADPSSAAGQYQLHGREERLTDVYDANVIRALLG